MSNVFFSSDHHFGHENIIKYCSRPYSSAEEMNKDLIARWNSVVEERDIVYYLGDFSMQPNYVQRILPHLNFKEIYLYMGNHDAPFKSLKKWQQQYLDWGFTTIQYAGQLLLDKTIFNLCHLPYKGGGDSSSVERYSEYRLEDDGGWLLNGHIHEKWKTQGKQINVGVDVWEYTPVHASKILEIVKNK